MLNQSVDISNHCEHSANRKNPESDTEPAAVDKVVVCMKYLSPVDTSNVGINNDADAKRSYYGRHSCRARGLVQKNLTLALAIAKVMELLIVK